MKNQLSEQRPSEEIRDKLGIQDISMVMRQMGLWWFGPLESMNTAELGYKMWKVDDSWCCRKGKTT